MSTFSPIIPRQPVPALDVTTTDGKGWSLKDQTPDAFTLIVVYRGLHCPICKPYLRDLDRKLGDIAEFGVEAIAISTDDAERARTAREDWGIDKLTIGHGLSLDQARDWGLFISSGIGKTSIGVEEPAMFAEPGIFLVRPDGTLYFSSVQTMPFARPHFEDILMGLKIVRDRNYPARGEIVDHKAPAAAE